MTDMQLEELLPGVLCNQSQFIALAFHVFGISCGELEPSRSYGIIYLPHLIRRAFYTNSAHFSGRFFYPGQFLYRYIRALFYTWALLLALSATWAWLPALSATWALLPCLACYRPFVLPWPCYRLFLLYGPCIRPPWSRGSFGA